MNHNFDVLIIGGGAVGCAVARELSRYDLSIALVEKEADVAAGASGRNSAVVHAGFNNKPGSLMAKLCVEGNQGFEAACQELDVPYRKTGKLLVAFDQADLDTLARLKAQGEENGCRGLRLLPQGYDTMLTGDGASLSQGQRQLLAIARAAIADPPVLILDEATSSIDTRTEKLVQEGMDALMKGRTVFVIAHRLSTVMNSDCIMVLDHGRIIERGSHAELMEKRGRYYQLYTGAASAKE